MNWNGTCKALSSITRLTFVIVGTDDVVTPVANSLMIVEQIPSVTPEASGCEECEKEGTEWVGLHLCTMCGHVGCDDSSKGMHATKHFVNTGHPVIVALPHKPWKWRYIDKIYG